MNKKGFTVFSVKLAHQLAKQGFKIIGTGINNKKPQYYCYHFEDSKELREAVRQLTASKQF